MNVAYNMDCMEGMKQYPDKYFDLAVVDPPYGDALANESGGSGTGSEGGSTSTRLRFHGGSKNPNDRWNKCLRPLAQQLPQERSGVNRANWHGKNKYHLGVQDGGNLGDKECKKIISWDVAPGAEYFEELFRISRNQIIWGGNYFPLPPTRCFLVWRKTNIPLEGFSMAPVEYAWTSYNENARVFEFFSNGGPGRGDRFHPTQKPKAIYDWIFSKYAKPGMKILDTHLGSGSSRLAAYDAGLDFVGYEIDKFYFDKQEERFNAHTAQQSLFADQGEQEELFDG